jgi:hypothetical protein
MQLANGVRGVSALRELALERSGMWPDVAAASQSISVTREC